MGLLNAHLHHPALAACCVPCSVLASYCAYSHLAVCLRADSPFPFPCVYVRRSLVPRCACLLLPVAVPPPATPVLCVACSPLALDLLRAVGVVWCASLWDRPVYACAACILASVCVLRWVCAGFLRGFPAGITLGSCYADAGSKGAEGGWRAAYPKSGSGGTATNG